MEKCLTVERLELTTVFQKPDLPEIDAIVQDLENAEEAQDDDPEAHEGRGGDLAQEAVDDTEILKVIGNY